MEGGERTKRIKCEGRKRQTERGETTNPPNRFGPAPSTLLESGLLWACSLLLIRFEWEACWWHLSHTLSHDVCHDFGAEVACSSWGMSNPFLIISTLASLCVVIDPCSVIKKDLELGRTVGCGTAHLSLLATPLIPAPFFSSLFLSESCDRYNLVFSL